MPESDTLAPAAPASGMPTVYFDGGCPVCSREIAFYRGQKGAETVQWVDAAACPPEAFGPGLDRDSALARIHVRQPDGQLVAGAEAFGVIWRQMPRFALVGRILSVRPVAAMAELGYGGFLKVRRIWR